MDSRDVGLGDIQDDEEGDEAPGNILDAGSDSDKSDDEEQFAQPRLVKEDSDPASDEDDDFASPPNRSANPPIPKPKAPAQNFDDVSSDEDEDLNYNQQANTADNFEEEDDEDGSPQVSVKDALKAQLSAKMGNQAPSKKAPPPPPEEGNGFFIRVNSD